MAIVISCPHCQRTLHLPEGCDGLAAKCPSCGSDFIVPGNKPATVTAAVCPVLAPVVGAVTISDVERARMASERTALADLELHIRLTEARRRRQRQATRLSTLQLFRSGRTALDHTVGRVGGFFLALTIGASLLVLLVSLFSPSAFGYFATITIGLILSGLAYVPFSFFPEDNALGPMIAQQSAKLASASVVYEQLTAEAADMHEKLTAAQDEYQRLKTAFESRLQWLRTCQWEGMTGANFENFLIKVFEERGYFVERTGRVGDQGVDLIVDREGSRVAIQAKGYPGTQVGNAAVQQVHAGMSFYRCQATAVITNSQFTPSARALAESTGCKLIDKSQILDLIEGRIVV